MKLAAKPPKLAEIRGEHSQLHYDKESGLVTVDLNAPSELMQEAIKRGYSVVDNRTKEPLIDIAEKLNNYYQAKKNLSLSLN